MSRRQVMKYERGIRDLNEESDIYNQMITD
jgi:hypothetical protein